MKRHTLVAALAFCAAAAGRSEAADVALELRAGYLDLTNASQSAEAVFDGARGGALVGAAVQKGLGEHYALRLGASYFSRSGERVFVADDRAPVFRLGHPLDVRVIPVYLDFSRSLMPDASLQPYLGLGAGIVFYNEESTVADITTSSSRTRPSGRLLLGATYGRGSLRFGAEIAYAWTPSTIGLGGVSKVYEEEDIGGATAVALLRWGW